MFQGHLLPGQATSLSQRHQCQSVSRVASAATATTGSQNPLSGPAEVPGHYHQCRLKAPTTTNRARLSQPQSKHRVKTDCQPHRNRNRTNDDSSRTFESPGLTRLPPHRTAIKQASRHPPALFALQSGQRRRQALRGAPWDRTDWPRGTRARALSSCRRNVSFFRRSLASGGNGRETATLPPGTSPTTTSGTLRHMPARSLPRLRPGRGWARARDINSWGERGTPGRYVGLL